MLNFLLQRNPLLAFAEGNAEKAGQGADDLDHLVAFVRLGHPDNRIQCVVEKMGVNLGLQRLQFCLFQVVMFLNFGVQQFADFADHDVEADAQFGDFVHVVVGH